MRGSPPPWWTPPVFSRPMIDAVVPLAADAFAASAIVALVERELGAGAIEKPPPAGPAVVFHVLASNVPALALPAIALRRPRRRRGAHQVGPRRSRVGAGLRGGARGRAARSRRDRRRRALAGRSTALETRPSRART
jgi:hypothetical protein